VRPQGRREKGRPCTHGVDTLAYSLLGSQPLNMDARKPLGIVGPGEQGFGGLL
jgi:hypothetical protein